MVRATRETLDPYWANIIANFPKMINIEQPTSNNQHPMVVHRTFTGCSMLNVGCWRLPVPTIPTGLQPSAQGWPRQRAPLGQPSKIFSNPNGVASARSTVRAPCSPSPRPSPSGRGRTIRRLSRKLAAHFFECRVTGFARPTSRNIEAHDCCSISVKERARVRGNAIHNFTALLKHATH